MKNLFDYGYYFCYQLSTKNRSVSPKENAVHALLIIFMVAELFFIVLITRITHLFFYLPKASNPLVNITIVITGNAYLCYWMSKYFHKHHKQIVRDRFKPIHTSATVYALIYLSIVITIIFLTAIITFFFHNNERGKGGVNFNINDLLPVNWLLRTLCGLF